MQEQRGNQEPLFSAMKYKAGSDVIQIFLDSNPDLNPLAIGFEFVFESFFHQKDSYSYSNPVRTIWIYNSNPENLLSNPRIQNILIASLILIYKQVHELKLLNFSSVSDVKLETMN